jgi:glycosyltransferase involved in cell wall biosynthesis
MPQKILWLCSWYPNDDDPFDGDFIQRHALAVSSFHSIEVLHVHKQLKSKGPVVYQKKELNENLTEHIFYNKVKKNNLFFRLAGLFRFFMIHFRFIHKNKRPDLIHVHIPMKAGMIALIYKWFYRIPYIVTEQYGFYNPFLKDNFKKRGFLYRAITRAIIKNASVLTTISDSLGKDMNNWVLKKEYTIVSNVVDTRLFRFIPKTRTDLFQFIHISNMIPLKNVEGIIAAAEKLWKQRKDFKLVFVGEIKKEYYELARVRNLLNTVVFFEGVLSYEKVAEKIQESDSMIIFSDTESQSCVVLEALCCGKPCIVTDTGGVKELIEDEVNGYKVNVRDTADLVHKMNRMINEYESFDKEKISNRATALYSYETVGKQFADCYKKAGKF